MKDAALTPIEPEAVIAALTAPFEPKVAADLRGHRVSGELDLRGRELCGFDLSGSVFEGPVLLDRCTTQGLSWFRGCTFQSQLSAQDSRFGTDLRLDEARINGNLTLSKAEFWGALVLDKARIASTAFLDNMQVLGSLSCADTCFDGPVSLEQTDALGGLWADATLFGSRVTAAGMEIHGRTWLRHVRFGDGSGNPMARLLPQIRLYGYLWN